MHFLIFRLKVERFFLTSIGNTQGVPGASIHFSDWGGGGGGKTTKRNSVLCEGVGTFQKLEYQNCILEHLKKTFFFFFFFFRDLNVKIHGKHSYNL